VFSRSTNGDQRQAEIADFAKQAVQRCLVYHRTTEQSGAVTLRSQAEPIEPIGPASFETPSEADFVLFSKSTSVVGLHGSKVRTDMVSAPHHMW